MKFHNLYESSVSEPEFKFYQNPTKEQMDEIAGENKKLHFIAYPEKEIVVFPHKISFGDFTKAFGGHMGLHMYDSIFGTAQNSGMGWMLTSIVNKEYLKNKSPDKWEWVNKYINVNPFFKHAGVKGFEGAADVG